MKVLVTGGSGFLGRAIVQQLRERGTDVRTFQRGKYADLESLGIECFRGNLGDLALPGVAVDALAQGRAGGRAQGDARALPRDAGG